MTDKKLTVDEIKKALLHCATLPCLCSDCILFEPDDDECRCSSILKLNALDVIRQYEKEKETYKDCFEKCFKDLKNAHTEARKEFAKLLIDKSKDGVIHISDIPDYVREMDEGKARK